MPADHPTGSYLVTITAEDMAHNVSSTQVGLSVVGLDEARTVVRSPCFPSLARAEPALEEFSGGAITDEVRGAMREALYEEVPLLGEPALAPRPAGLAKLRMDDVAARYPEEAAVQKYLGRVCYTTGDVTCAEHAYQAAVESVAAARPGRSTSWPTSTRCATSRRTSWRRSTNLADAQRPKAIGASATTDGKRRAENRAWSRDLRPGRCPGERRACKSH